MIAALSLSTLLLVQVLARDAGQDPAPVEAAARAQQEGNPWSATPSSTLGLIRAARESARVEAVEEPLLTAMLARAPWLAREVGQQGFDDKLGDFHPEQGAQWLRHLREARASLRTVRDYQLTPERRIDHSWLSNWALVEVLSTSSLPVARRDAAWYAESVLAGMASLVEAETDDVEQRLQSLELRLRESVGLWGLAQLNLIHPNPLWVQRALEISWDLVFYLEGPCDEFIDAHLEDEAALDVLHGARHDALTALRAHIEWLAHSLEFGEHKPWAMSQGQWESMAVAATGTERSLHEIEVRILADILRIERELGDDSHVPAPPRNTPEAERLEHMLRASLARARSLGLTAQILRPDMPVPEVAARAAISRRGPLMRRQWSQGDQARLDLLLPGAGWEEPASDTRYALLNPHDIGALALRYGGLGEEGILWQARHSESATRRLLINRATLEGFGLYTLDVVSRLDWSANPFAQDERTYAAMQRQLLLEAVRLWTSLQLHAEGATPEALTADIVVHTGLDAISAQREVLHSMRDPLWGIGYLAYVDILDIERALTRGPSDAENAVRQTRAHLLRHPCARPQDLVRFISRR